MLKILSIMKIIVLWSVVLAVFKMIATKSLSNPLEFAMGSFVQDGVLAHFWYLWMLAFLQC